MIEKDKDIHKELEGLSPLLAKMKPKKEMIKTPDNYFHYLEESVMQQVQLVNTPVLKSREKVFIPFWSRFFSGRSIVGFASVALLIIAGVYLNQMGRGITENSMQFAELTDADILNYLSDNAEELDIYSLSEMDKDVSILDMIDLGENDIDYFFDESSTELINEEILDILIE